MRRPLWLVAVAITAACNSSFDCTLIGCVSGLTVVIDNAPPGPITIEATTSGAPGPIHTGACPATIGCTNTVFLAAFTPSRAQLTVTTTAGTRQQEVTPNYVTSQQNGRRCSPTCRNATVHIAWQ